MQIAKEGEKHPTPPPVTWPTSPARSFQTASVPSTGFPQPSQQHIVSFSPPPAPAQPVAPAAPSIPPPPRTFTQPSTPIVKEYGTDPYRERPE